MVFEIIIIVYYTSYLFSIKIIMWFIDLIISIVHTKLIQSIKALRKIIFVNTVTFN